MFWKVKDIYRRDEGRAVGRRSKGEVVGAHRSMITMRCASEEDERTDWAMMMGVMIMHDQLQLHRCMFVSFSLEHNATVVSNYFKLSTIHHFLSRSRSAPAD